MRTSIGGRPRNATGLGRPRLLALLSQARPPAPALVVAPAGYGKTTLLAQCAAAHPGPVAWYTADSADGAGGLVLPRLCGAVRAAAGLPPTRDEHLGRLFADLVQATRDTVLLVIDNYEALAGTPAEDLVERTALAGPATLRVVVGSRRMPSLDPVRHEVASGIALVDADALRLRTWEVAQLLRVVHGQPLPAEEVAELTARTGGWPAAIQTYLLATRDRSPAERRRAVAELAGGSPVLRRYLDATLQAARADRAFLLRTSVFDVLTGARCDRLLGATGSAAVLTRLHAAGALPLTGDGDAYRCPEVLREHLHTMLAEEFGPEAARGWHRRAGDL
ncbi:MAG TPA: AAA family ATPase, partial [Pilimelia sp.]|nr:AAA family ATPase [Pilimelia sp.]